MDIIQNIFAEEDLQYMPDSMLEALSNLLDETLGKCFLEYLDNESADNACKERIRQCMGKGIEASTFHTLVLSSGVRDVVAGISVETLAYQNRDLDYLIETLKWVKANRTKMVSAIEPRKREDFIRFINECKSYDYNVELQHLPVKYPNVAERIQVNKKLFYQSNEKPKPTRIGLIIKRDKDCDIALKGAEYLKYCSEHSVTGYRRTEF